MPGWGLRASYFVVNLYNSRLGERVINTLFQTKDFFKSIAREKPGESAGLYNF